MGRFTIREIIEHWPSVSEFAADLGMAGRKGTRLAHMWIFRRNIPAVRFPVIVAAAHKRGYKHLDLQSLYVANEISGATQ